MMRFYYRTVYLLSWPLFAAGAAVLGLLCGALLVLPRTPGTARRVRGWIRGLFCVWTAWLHRTGLIRIEWENPTGGPLPHPAVYVANHPGLLDATILLSRLPETVCIVKPAVMRNPLLGPAARAAGYAAGDGGVDTLRAVIDGLLGGQAVLIFPEGTRTAPSCAFNPLKPGFALIARRAAAPIQVLLIEGSRDLLPRGAVWWKIPHLPARYRIRVDTCFTPAADASAEDIAAVIATRFATQLTPG
jgi:1-acyl-sn-glycerol-3-phosphate acyltransferase